MNKRILDKLNSLLIVLIFCAAIFIPLLVALFEQDEKTSTAENRNLANAPKQPASINEFKNFPPVFDLYYSDHFGLRDWFLKYYKLVKYSIGDTPSNDVVIGKNGWLFLGSIEKGYKKYSDPVGDVRNANLFSQKDLIKFSTHIKSLKSLLNNKGIEYVLVIVPNKHTVYFEQLPDYISKINKQSAADQLVEHLKKHTDVSVIDLRAPLIAEKEKHQLYFKIDTHWNHFAANIAQYEIIKRIESLFPGKIQAEKTRLSSGVVEGGDLEYLLGVDLAADINPQPVFENSCVPLKQPIDAKPNEVYTTVCENQMLNAVIFRDSFFTALEPYISRKFKRATYLLEEMNYASLVKYIELEKPDIVIEEWVERSLPFVPKGFDELNVGINKKIFNHSKKYIFSNDWSKLKFSQQIKLLDNSKDSINLISTGEDPIVTFPPLAFMPNSEYILHINLESSVASTLQLFYSDVTETGYPFTGEKSLRIQVNKGNNDIYLRIDYPQLGRHLRLDPISRIGEISINTLEIKQVQ